MLHAKAFQAPWSPAAFRAELAKPAAFALALMQDGADNIISFALFQRALDEADLLTLATEPSHQGRGHARTLLKVAFAHLQDRGVRRCLLDVAADNANAIHLYKKLGFSEDGRREKYYKRGEYPSVDALLMSTDLTGLYA